MTSPASGRRAAAACILALLPASAPAADVPATLTAHRRDALVNVVEQMKAAVINLHSERTLTGNSDDPFRHAQVAPQRVNGMGTGIVLDPRGYLITNYHVIDDVQALRARTVDGKQYAARVLAADKKADLALVKIDAPGPLPTVPLGTAQDLLDAEQVLAIGNAFGYEHTVSVGYVAYKSRDVTLNKEISYSGLIQTTTPINPGNSGGPLFNKKGELVGVNVAIRAGAQNIAFAIPVDTMIDRAADMLSVKRREGKRHGLVVKDHVARDAEESKARRWVTVASVEPDSPADKAGVRPGDTLERINNINITSSIDVERGFLEAGAEKIAVKLVRAGQPADATLSLQTLERPGTAGIDTIVRKTGLRLSTAPKEAVVRADPQLRGGMTVLDVTPGTPGARAGLTRGDIIIGFHLWESLNPDNVLFALDHKDRASFSPLKTYFVRDGKLRETTLTTD
jgi:serine protease Do